ncbi:hypothetical protein ACIOHS_02365 [Streptomyces sp. NPDC088253]|uniref:hypothetical protein n=1 Tax=Streptomyces sp. NPDC088253 TaxID=3365846 RepID=UPI0038215862
MGAGQPAKFALQLLAIVPGVRIKVGDFQRVQDAVAGVGDVEDRAAEAGLAATM